MDYNTMQMGKLKKPVVIVGVVLVTLGVAAAVYLLVIKKDKTQVPASAPADSNSQQSISATNPADELKAAGDVYSDATAVKILNAAELYSTQRDYDKMKDALTKIPDSAAVSVLSQKFRLLTSMYRTQSNLDMYLKTKAAYKAILVARPAKDTAAKKALAVVDKIFPENTAPSVTYPEGQEQP